MPELPEVETILTALKPVTIGQRIVRTEVLRQSMVQEPLKIKRLVKNIRVLDLRRHGKYLFINLENNLTLVLHLRMSGRLAVRKISDAEFRHERLRLVLQKNLVLVFNDPRTLGRIFLAPTDSLASHPRLKLLGPDALTVSQRKFIDRLKARKGVLKAVLLNQSFVAGIGNIYADETCFRARLDPRRKVQTLSKPEREKLHRAAIATLKKGIRNRGTSISDFLGLHGKPGINQNSLSVYGRKGRPCRSCGTILKSTKIQQRTTVWCPECQR